MRTQCVEVNAPLLDQNSGFAQAVEQFAIEPMISKLAVKALAIPVLPRAARRDVGGVRETLKKSGLKLDNAIFRCYDTGVTP